MSGLVRTSVSPPRFIFMGADIGHHASQWRPNEFLSLPDELSPSPLGIDSKLNLRTNVCLGELFTENVHPQHSNNTPFCGINHGHPYDAEMAQRSLKLMEPFDADEKILVIAAHDHTLVPYLEYWPKESNGWHEAHWKELNRWEFLKDFTKIIEEKTRGSGEGY